MEIQNVSLRRNWNHITATLPPGAERIAVLLDEGLAELETTGDYQEPRLLALVGEATTLADRLLSPDESTQLSHRLHRGVYEYLLAVDAMSREQLLENDQATGPPLEETQPMDKASPDESSGWRALREQVTADGDNGEEPESSPSRGFRIFKRKNKDKPAEAETAEEAVKAAPESAELSTHPAAAGSQQRSATTHDGFHLGHPEDLGIEEAPQAKAEPPDEVEAEAPVEAEPQPPVEIEAVAEAEIEAVVETFAEEPEPPAPAAEAIQLPDETAGLVDREFDITEARRDIEDRLRRKKCDEAASMLQQLAQEVGGREVAELAVDAGDRCRGLGKRRAATNCYLAAARSDPVYAVPLSCLADICLDDQDIELAVSYLERVARLHHIRGDDREALRFYRKIATIAPYREDILELLVRAQTQG